MDPGARGRGDPPRRAQGDLRGRRIHQRRAGRRAALRDGDTVLVGQYRYTLDEWSWEIPEGGGDPGRPPLDEAARELREETGLIARQWTPLGPVHTSNSVTDEAGLLWLAEDLSQHVPAPDGTEQLELWRLPLGLAVDMADDGRISDAMSVVGLLRVQRLLDRR